MTMHLNHFFMNFLPIWRTTYRQVFSGLTVNIPGGQHTVLNILIFMFSMGSDKITVLISSSTPSHIADDD